MREWLLAIRDQEDRSQEEVASAVGLKQPSYSNIENDVRDPSPRKAKAIARYLDFKKYGCDWTKFYEEEKE